MKQALFKQALFFIAIVFSSTCHVNGQSHELPNSKRFKAEDYKSDTLYTKYIDFKKSNSLYLDTLRYNRKYRYIIKNVNRFIYKEVSADQKGENLNIERPEIFKGIKLPGFATISKVSEAPELSSKHGQKSAPKKSKCECISIDTLISDLQLNTRIKTLKEASSLFKNTIDTFFTFSGLNHEFERLKTRINLSWGEIMTRKNKFLKDSLNLNITEVDDTNNITKKYESLRGNAKLIVKVLDATSQLIIGPVDSVIANFENCISRLHINLRCLDSCKNKEAFIKIEDSIRTLIKCINELKAFSAGIKTDITEARDAVGSIDRALFDDKINTLQDNYNVLVHQNFELELEPFIADKDVHEIIFTTGTEGPLEFGLPSKRIIKINTITTGGLKVDYSTGAFYNWGNNNFLGPTYYYEKPSDSTKIIREAGRTKKAMLSIGALMHISVRVNFPVRPAISFGVSATSGFDALNFHGGLSAIIGKAGKPNRLILTIGTTLREVDLLNTRYSLGIERKDYPDEIPVSKNFPVWGGFFAITYNLKGINK